jgi:hypothetical protein
MVAAQGCPRTGKFLLSPRKPPLAPLRFDGVVCPKRPVPALEPSGSRGQSRADGGQRKQRTHVRSLRP